MAGETDNYKSSAAYKTSSEAEEASGSGSLRSSQLNDDDDDIFQYNQVPKPHLPAFAEDKLEKELQISVMDCRVPLIPFEEFYNELLSDAMQMDRDYLSYKNLSLDPLEEGLTKL